MKALLAAMVWGAILAAIVLATWSRQTEAQETPKPLPIVRWEGDAIRVDCDSRLVLCDDEGA